MKGKFYAPAELMQLDETLKEHQPYAALVVSTTGLDNSEFSEHSPTRVCMKQYEWDEPTKFYRESINFDKMVQAPQEAVLAALKEAEKENGYDVFKNGGIDKEAYIKGEGVLSVDDFKKEFDRMINAVKETNATLIINSSKHAETYLDKIGCADGIKELSEQGKVLDQTRLTQEYFQKEGISGKATLEALRNVVVPSPTASFAKDEDKLAQFKALSKEDFLKANPTISERAYNVTAKDVAFRESKIEGGNNRIDVINAFVAKHGRDEHILESEYRTHMRESDNAYIENLSEKGKEKYKNNSFHGKFGTLIEKGTIKPDEILNGNSEFHKLMSAVENKDNKGLIVIHAASTGFDRSTTSPQKRTGFPIKFTATIVSRQEDGTLEYAKKYNGVNMTIAAPSRDVLRAEQNINDPKHPYDTFKEAGIDLEDYKAGKDVLSQDNARDIIRNFFKSHDPNDFAIVAIGGTYGTDKSFTQTCISNLGNFSVCEAPYIDFAQVIKDYAFLAEHDDNYQKNVMFRPENMNSKTFGIQDVGSANGMDIHTPLQKCLLTIKLIDRLEQQQIEMFRPEELNKEQVSEEKSPEKQADVLSKSALAEELSKAEIGTPLKVSVTKEGDYSQVLLAEKEDGVFTFMGENNIFRLSEEFINNNDTITAIFNDNEPEKVTAITQKLQAEKAENEAEISEDEAFFEEDKSYENVVREEPEIASRNEPEVPFAPSPEDEIINTPEEQKIVEQAENEAFLEAVEAITAGVGGGIAHAPHGNLYSDKENDHIPVVKASGVEKVGEAPVPHISEAFREPQGKDNSHEETKLNHRRKRPVKEAYREAFKEDSNRVIDFPKPTRPVQAQGVEQLDVSRLVEVISAQSEMISAQSAVIAEQNTKLMSILQEQNQFMKTVLEMNMQTQERQMEVEKPVMRPEPINVKDEKSVIEYMESIKEQISSLREQLPSEKAKAHLGKANEALSNGQKEMELNDKNKDVTRSVS